MENQNKKITIMGIHVDYENKTCFAWNKGIPAADLGKKYHLTADVFNMPEDDLRLYFMNAFTDDEIVYVSPMLSNNYNRDQALINETKNYHLDKWKVKGYEVINHTETEYEPKVDIQAAEKISAARLYLEKINSEIEKKEVKLAECRRLEEKKKSIHDSFTEIELQCPNIMSYYQNFINLGLGTYLSYYSGWIFFGKRHPDISVRDAEVWAQEVEKNKKK